MKLSRSTCRCVASVAFTCGILIVLAISQVAAQANQTLSDLRSCPLMAVARFSDFNAARILIESPDERRKILLRTLAFAGDSSALVEARIQLQTPSANTNFSLNSLSCDYVLDGGVTTTSSNISEASISLLSQQSAACDAPQLCATSFFLPLDKPLMMEYSRNGFASTECGYTASVTVTTNASLDFYPDVQYVSHVAANSSSVNVNSTASVVYSFVGNTSDVNSLASPVSYLLSPSAGGGVASATLATISGLDLSVSCTWGNLRAYKLMNIPRNTLPPSWALSFTYSYCLGFNTVPAIHMACDADHDCLGYTSYYYGNPCTEYPYCLLYADGGNSSNNLDPQDRLFSLKQSRDERTCAAVAGAGGNYSVWVLENYLSKSTVQVFVDGLFAGLCPPLPNSIRPLNSQCSTYALCHVGHADANSTISVVVSQQAAQGGCDVGAAVLIRLDAVDPTQRVAVRSSSIQSPQLSLDLSTFATQVIGMSDIGIAYRKLSFFVRAAQRFLLNVTQSVFGPCASSRCPSIILSVNSKSVQCGSRAGFVNGTEGLSNQCNVRFPCGDVLELVTPFTGFIYVELMDFDTDASLLCKPFSAVLMAAPPMGPHQPFGFVLGSSKTAFEPVYGISPPVGGDPLSDSASISGVYNVIVSSTSPNLYQSAVMNFGNYSWISLTAAVDLFQRLRLPGTQACLMDDITFGGTCQQYVPAGSNFATVRVLQSLSSSSYPVNVYFWQDDVLLDSVVCVQNEEFVGTTRACSTLSTCYSRFVRQSDTHNFNFVTISVGGGAGHAACDTALAVLVTYENRSSAVADGGRCAAGTPYLCQADRKCIAASKVCDSVADCSDASDEALCRDNFAVETDSDFADNSSILMSMASPTVDSCRRSAILALAASANPADLMYAFDAARGACRFFTNGIAPLRQYNASVGSVVYEYLPGGPTSYTGCSRIASCSNHGEATSSKSGQCTCSCDPLFAGAHCEHYLSPSSTTADLVVHVGVSKLSDTANIAISQVVEALSQFSGWSQITCQPFEAESALSVITLCTVTGNDNAAVALRQFSAKYPFVMFAEQLSSTAYLSLSNCQEQSSASVPSTSAVNVSTTCTGFNSTSYRWLKLSAGAAIAPDAMLYSINSGPLTSCVDQVLTIGEDGCVAATCIVRPGSGDFLFSVTGVSVHVQYSLNTEGDDCLSVPTVLGFSAVDPPILPGLSSLTYSSKAFFGFAIGSAIFFVGTIIFAVYACVELGRNERARQARLRIAHTSLSDVIRMLREIFLRPLLEENTIIDEGRLATIFAVAAYNLCAVALLLLLLYVTNIVETTASFSAMLELYSDPSCAAAASTMTYVPFVVALVQADHGACDRATMTGELPFPIFVDAVCTQEKSSDDVSTYATVQFGLSAKQCTQAPSLKLLNGSCVRVFGAFMKVLCDDTAPVLSRFKFFSSLFGASSTASRQRLLPTPIPPEFMPTRRADGIFLRPFLQSSLLPSSSQLPNRLSSIAAMDYFFQNAAQATERIVFQDDSVYMPSFGITPPSAISELADGLISSYDPAVQAFTPLDMDLPFGFVMNRFNSTYSSSIGIRQSSGLPAESQAYLAVRSSMMDIGYYFGPNTIDDSLGFTMKCYVRVSDSSRGFIFALTDALLDRQTLQSPLLARLEQFIVKSIPDSEWDEDVLSIYLALYFNGAARALSLSMATPAHLIKPGEGARVFISEWNLDELSIPLTNGAWHQVAVILRNDNGQVKAQLVVDGRTSKSLAGWNLCWPRRPQPITAIETLGAVLAADPLAQVLYPGGMLVVGAIEGAVARVEFSNMVVSQGVLLLKGTSAMRRHVDLRRTDILNIAIVLFVFSFVLTVLTAASSGFAIAEGEEAEEADFIESVVAAFVEVVRFVATDESGEAFQRLPYEQARRWLKFTHAQMLLFLDELEQNTAKPHTELIRVLYLTRVSQLEQAVLHRSTPLPSTKQWAWLLERDAEAFAVELTKPVGWFDEPAVPDQMHPLEEKLAEEKVVVEKSLSYADRKAIDDLDGDDADVHFSNRGGAAVDLGGGFGKTRDGSSGTGSTTSDAGSGSGGASQMSTELYNMLLPVITSLQTVYVWASSVTVPGDYLSSFGKLMSTISVDIASLARTLAPYATPLLQLLAAIAICSFMYYLCVYDNEVFDWYLARYTLRRDERKRRMEAKHKSLVAAGKREQKTAPAFATSLLECEVLSNTENIFAHPPPCNYEYQLSILSLREAQNVDGFCGVHDESDDEVVDSQSITVEDVSGNTFVLAKNPPPEDRLSERQTRNAASNFSVSSTSKLCTPFLEVAGCYCRHHPNRLLSGQLQNQIWPFANPPKCCVVNNGMPCGETNGMIFSCGAIHLNAADELAICDFALCQRHCRFSPAELILSQFVGFTRLARQRGFRWVLAALLLIVANAVYMPFMRTVLMILACHPFYQCTFKCWSNADQLFVIAAYLCVFIFLILGVGLPLLQAWLLHRRRALFEVVFFSDEYLGEYVEKTEDIMKQLDKMTPKKVVIALITGQGVKFVYRKILQLLFEAYGHVTRQSQGPRGDDLNQQGEGEQNRSSQQDQRSAAAAKVPAPAILNEDRDVAVEEWQRFLSCDPSAMAVLYNTLELKYMYMTPIFLLFKVVLISPVVFLEPESYVQRLAMMVVEIAFAALIFGTAPFISPVVDAMYRIASIHQLLLLGLQNLDTVHTMDGKTSLGSAMMATSFAYLAICVVCIIYTSIYPALVQIRDVKKSHRMLSRLGLHYSMTTSLYVSPIVGEGEKLVWKDCLGTVEPAREGAVNPLRFDTGAR